MQPLQSFEVMELKGGNPKCCKTHGFESKSGFRHSAVLIFWKAFRSAHFFLCFCCSSLAQLSSLMTTCVQAQGTLSSPPTPDQLRSMCKERYHPPPDQLRSIQHEYNVQETLSSSPSTPNQLRSIQHVCQCKERYHPPPDQLRSIQHVYNVQGTLSSSPSTPNQLRSMQHVCQCKERYHPPLTSCVASSMCTSARNVVIPPLHPKPVA